MSNSRQFYGNEFQGGSFADNCKPFGLTAAIRWRQLIIPSQLDSTSRVTLDPNREDTIVKMGSKEEIKETKVASGLVETLGGGATIPMATEIITKTASTTARAEARALISSLVETSVRVFLAHRCQN